MKTLERLIGWWEAYKDGRRWDTLPVCRRYRLLAGAGRLRTEPYNRIVRQLTVRLAARPYWSLNPLQREVVRLILRRHTEEGKR